MKTRIAAVLLALACAAPADAQNVVDGALSDLNGDGLRERFTLLHYPGADTADLRRPLHSTLFSQHLLFEVLSDLGLRF